MMHSSSRNGNDIGSFVMEVVESAEASEYSKKISRNVRRGMTSEQQKGYSRGGTSPYGYRRVAIDLQTGERKMLRAGHRAVPKIEKVVWELGESLEVETVRRIFNWKADGWGYVKIAHQLNAEGIPSPKRGRWRNLDQKWSGVTVKGLIQNPGYTGDRVYNRLSFSKFKAEEQGVEFEKKHKNNPSEWQVEKDSHPAIIPREIFERANAQAERHPVKPNQHYYQSVYLLTGLIKCDCCGFNYQGFFHKKSGNRYYVDGGYVNKGSSVCSWHSIPQKKLEDFLLASIQEKLLTSNIRARVEEEVAQLLDNQPDESRHRLEATERHIVETRTKIQNLLQLAEKGI
jgi:site-specific DNA recombinase